MRCADLADKEGEAFDPFAPFALRWIAWEALRTRMLVVAARLRGCRMEDAYRVIGALRISSNNAFADCLGRLAGYKWRAKLRGEAAKGWLAFRQIEIVRHRLFHGYKTVNPAITSAASRFLSRAVPNNEMIFGEISIEYVEGVSNQIGNALKRYPSAGKKIPIIMSAADLQNLFADTSISEAKSKLPSLKDAELWDIFDTSPF